MNLEQINKMVEEIKSISGDDERAHSLEDDLHQSVLKHHADNGIGCFCIVTEQQDGVNIFTNAFGLNVNIQR